MSNVKSSEVSKNIEGYENVIDLPENYENLTEKCNKFAKK